MIYAHSNTFVILQLEVGNLNELVYSRLDRAEERISIINMNLRDYEFTA